MWMLEGFGMTAVCWQPTLLMTFGTTDGLSVDHCGEQSGVARIDSGFSVVQTNSEDFRLRQVNRNAPPSTTTLLG